MIFKRKASFFINILLITFIFTNCSDQSGDQTLEAQNSYLIFSIKQANEQFQQDVTGSGSPEHGRLLLKHINSLLEDLKTIKKIKEVDRIKELTIDYLQLAFEPLVSEDEMNFPVSDAIDELDKNNVHQFKSLLQVFTKDLINHYHLQFLNRFSKFDIVSVNVLDQGLNYGEEYRATISLNATMSTLRPEISVSNKKDGDYRPIIVDVYNRGIFTIGKYTPGKHKFYIKYKYLDFGKEKTINTEHEFTILK